MKATVWKGMCKSKEVPRTTLEEPAPVHGLGAGERCFLFFTTSFQLGRSWEGVSSTKSQLTLTKLTHARTGARPLYSSPPPPHLSQLFWGGLLNPLSSLNQPTPGSQAFGSLCPPPESSISFNIPSFLFVSFSLRRGLA